MHELRNAAAGQSTPSTPRAAAEVQVLRCFRSHLEDGGEGGSLLCSCMRASPMSPLAASAGTIPAHAPGHRSDRGPQASTLALPLYLPFA